MICTKKNVMKWDEVGIYDWVSGSVLFLCCFNPEKFIADPAERL